MTLRSFAAGSLVLLAFSGTSTTSAEDPTFAKDIAPILYANCVECHRPGMVAPFSLLTYEDAAKRADFLKAVTGDRQMPPWHAQEGDFAFQGERRLSPAEIETIARWADSGAKRGDESALPTPPTFHDAWQLGEPDVVTEMAAPFEVPADGPDLNLAFRLKIPIDRKRYLRGIEIRPGAPAVVHHAVALIDPAPSSDPDDKPGQPTAADFAGFGGGSRFPLPGLMGSWTPGSEPGTVPPEFAMAVEPGWELVLQIHYNPSGKPETDRTKVALYFGDEPPQSPLLDLFYQVNPLSGNTGMLDIPAGEARHEVRIQGIVPIDAQAFGIKTHAHYRMTDGTVTAKLPDGKKVTLLSVKDWDFDWQERYVFEKDQQPKLPEGTILEFVGYFDNSAANPQNPFSPPRDVRYGLESDDEMFGFCVSLIPTGDDRAATRGKWMAYLEERRKLPPGGLPIPDDKPMLRQRFDRDQDGRLTQEELESIPEANGLRKMVQDFFRTQVVAADGSPAVNGSADVAPLRLPAEGVAIKADWKLIRDRVDTDGDDILTQAEFDAAPDAVRGKLAEFLRRQLGDKLKPAESATEPTPSSQDAAAG